MNKQQYWYNEWTTIYRWLKNWWSVPWDFFLDSDVFLLSCDFLDCHVFLLLCDFLETINCSSTCTGSVGDNVNVKGRKLKQHLTKNFITISIITLKTIINFENKVYIYNIPLAFNLLTFSYTNQHTWHTEYGKNDTIFKLHFLHSVIKLSITLYKIYNIRLNTEYST